MLPAEFPGGNASATSDDLGGADLALPKAGVIHHRDDDEVGAMVARSAGALGPTGRSVALPVENLFVRGQRGLRVFNNDDRGQQVRDPHAYLELAAALVSLVRHIVVRTPCTHCILECRDSRKP
jgi:hypothetical protein